MILALFQGEHNESILSTSKICVLSGVFIAFLNLYFLTESLNSKQFVSFFLSFQLIGYRVSKSNVILKLKQGKEPWRQEVKLPRRKASGELQVIPHVIRRGWCSCLLKYF